MMCISKVLSDQVVRRADIPTHRNFKGDMQRDRLSQVLDVTAEHLMHLANLASGDADLHIS